MGERYDTERSRSVAYGIGGSPMDAVETLDVLDSVDSAAPVDVDALWFGLADDPALIAAARRLQGRVYLERGFVVQLDDGMVDDPYVPHARYFVAVAPDGRVVGVCRQILGRQVALPTLS